MSRQAWNELVNMFTPPPPELVVPVEELVKPVPPQALVMSKCDSCSADISPAYTLGLCSSCIASKIEAMTQADRAAKEAEQVRKESEKRVRTERKKKREQEQLLGIIRRRQLKLELKEHHKEEQERIRLYKFLAKCCTKCGRNGHDSSRRRFSMRSTFRLLSSCIACEAKR